MPRLVPSNRGNEYVRQQTWAKPLEYVFLIGFASLAPCIKLRWTVLLEVLTIVRDRQSCPKPAATLFPLQPGRDVSSGLAVNQGLKTVSDERKRFKCTNFVKLVANEHRALPLGKVW